MEENMEQLFGQSVETQEVAEPVTEQTEPQEGGNGQEVAEPAGGDDNSRFAAARRKAEAERDTALKEQRERFEGLISSIGMVNPYTGEPVRDEEGLSALVVAQQEDKKNQLLRKSGMTAEELDAYIESLPEVQQAKQSARDAEEAQAKARVSEQIREIEKLDPTIRNLEDLAGLPEYPAIYQRVKSGMSLSDAYKLVCFDKLTQQNANAVRQSTIQANRTKGHLQQTQQRGTGSDAVPAEVMAMYRTLNPNKTDAEIVAHYNRCRK